MKRKERTEYDEALNELVDEIRTERQIGGEADSEPVVLSDEQVQEVLQDKFNELYSESETAITNPVMGIIALISLILFFVSFIVKSDDLLGFAISGIVLSPAFVTTVRSNGIKRKATWKDRIIFIVIGGFLLYSAIVQAFGTNITE